MPKKKAALQYYKVSENRKQYIGHKFFRYNFETEICVQICFAPGEVSRRGKSNSPGITIISKITFFTNYLAPGYINLTTEKDFKTHFDKIVEVLS